MSGYTYTEVEIVTAPVDKVGQDLSVGDFIVCGCGCGRRFNEYDSKGRTRRFIHGHNNRTHGHTRSWKHSPTYSSWDAMLARCCNPKNMRWKHYGGANPPVKVCKRWMVFENFLHDMGERPRGKTLGRFNDIGDYQPKNCAWQTYHEQAITQWAQRRQIDMDAAATETRGSVIEFCNRINRIRMRIRIGEAYGRTKTTGKIIDLMRPRFGEASLTISNERTYGPQAEETHELS